MVQFSPSFKALAAIGNDDLPVIQAHLYSHLKILLPTKMQADRNYRSVTGRGPALFLKVLERHKYTDFLRLTHRFAVSTETDLAPNAHIRIYHDAKLAEVTAFNGLQGIRRYAAPWLPAQHVLYKNIKQNRALLKWLDHLHELGHSSETLKPFEIKEHKSLS